LPCFGSRLRTSTASFAITYENEIYTIDYSNRFTAQVLYRLDYKWPVTDDRYLENAIAALDRLTFFD
ncbi:hypothetical protein DXD14_13450, partial [Ruminococcus sp. TF11-2AC]